MSELPEGWQVTTLGECFLEVKNGTTATQNKLANGIPVSRIETIQSNKFDLSRVHYIENPSDELVDVYKYQEGDIAFSHINSFEHVGKTALYEGNPETLIHGMNLLRLRRRHEYIDPKYAHFFMRSKFFREEVRKRVGHAVNQVSINQKNLSEVPFVLAPLNEQRRIVAKLEKLLTRVDAAQARLVTIPQILKRFRQSILAAACSGRLTANWRDSRPAEICDPNPTVVKDDDLPEIPDGWSWSSFGEVAEIASNLVDPDKFPNLPLIAPDNIEKGSGRLLEYKTVREIAPISPKHYFYPNQIIYSKIRPYLSKLIVSEFEGLCSADMYPINSRINMQYLFYYMLSDTFLGFVDSSGTRTLLPKINQKELARISVPVPPESEQQEIVRRVEALFKTADTLEARYVKAKAHVDKLTQSILARAFRGELVTTEAELARQEGRDYEPASVLLERIHQERAQQQQATTKRKPKQSRAARKKAAASSSKLFT